jgi:hypothetical protein
MKKKCKQGHEMEDGHKRCPECGGEPAETGAVQGAQVLKCKQGHDNPPLHKCCSECGDPLGSAGASEYLEALAGFDTLVKANANLGDELTPPDAGAEIELDDLYETVDGKTEVNGEKLIDALFKSQNRGLQHGIQIGNEARATHKAVNSSTEAQHRQFVALGKRLDAMENQIGTLVKSVTDHFSRSPNDGRAKSRLVVPHDRQMGGGPEVNQDTSPAGEELFTKCDAAMAAGKLTADDMMTIDSFNTVAITSGVRLSLDAIKAHDPALGARVEQAITPVH